MPDYDLRVISLGAGVQSTTLYRMAALGELDSMPDLAIFADTQCEPAWVYETLDLLERDHRSAIPIVRASRGSLLEAIESGVNATGQRFASVPFWIKSGDGRGMGRRQCTREYKIDVIKREIRNQLGLRPRERAAGRFQVEQWIGISTDEAHRAKPSRDPWIVSVFPLLEARMGRRDCVAWLERRGYPVPGKSACVFCPYRRPVEYARWRDEKPELFEEACRVDEMIRSTGTMRGMRGQQFIWDKLRPLRELPSVAELEGRDEAQIDLFGNECEGLCGV